MRSIVKTRKLISLVLICLMVASIFQVAPVLAADEDSIEFSRDENGRPIFDGVPSHLDSFVDLILSNMSIEDLAYYADQKNAGGIREIEAGYTLPGTATGGVDRVMGVSTDMPSMLALGQTWNKELVNRVGTVMGNERRGEVDLDNPNTLMFSIVSDLRINPLSGRFEEGYGEDPVLAGTLINSMAKGITGYGEEGNKDGFWLKVQLGTKHYTNYLAQWFRTTGQFYASSRALNEYQMRSFLHPLESGLVVSIMTTYGRTNGIPNHVSPNIIRATNANPYSMMPVGDFIFADRQMTDGFNNGYQNYTDNDGSAALLLLSGNHANTMSSNYEALVSAVNNGTFGVGRDQLEDSVRGQLEMWVRTGYFNAKNKDGSPVEYPFSDLSGDRNPVDYTLEENQDVALDAARESIVLLKNTDDLLPISKDNSVAVTGIFADTRFKATYSVGTTPEIEGSGLSPLGAIRDTIGEENVTFGTGAKIVAFESVSNNQTATASEDEEGAPITVSYIPKEGITVVDSVYNYIEDGKAYTVSQAFESYAWGQNGYSYKSLANNKWLNYMTSGWRPSLYENNEIRNDDETSLNLTENPFSNVADASSLPGRFRREANDDGTVSLVGNSYSESFGGGVETYYYVNGRFVTVDDEDYLKISEEIIGDKENADARTNAEKFNEIVLKEAGADAEVWASENEYAVVVVGTPSRHSAGEGADHSDLNLGEDQYEIVSQVGESFPGKTIVIVKSNSPVNMQPIQDDDNVAAILYQPYAGQYDSKALADVIFGDYAPTGRLSTTWYSGTESFPEINKYSLPEGTTPETLEEIDPRFTVDMSNGDPIESKMTYMYTDADVTYEFGFGLSYSTFEYSNLVVPEDVSGKEAFEVTVDVENTGNTSTDEVVQLYIHNDNSAYGDYSPKKKLVSYEKVRLRVGESKTVTLTVEPSEFAVWDVNRCDYIIESGKYTLMAGSSSEILPLEEKITYSGESIADLNAASAPVNVFDAAFATNNVAYREVSKIRTAKGLLNKQSEYGYYAVTSKANGAWAALKQVDLTGMDSITISAASENASSNIEVRADSPNGTPLALITLEATSSAKRDVEGSDFKVVELDYTDVTEDLFTTMTGTHDLYIVFKAADIRVDSIQLNGEGASQFTVDTPEFKDANGNTLTRLVPSADLRAEVSITNGLSIPGNACLILALYSADGSVKNISYLDGEIGAGQTYDFNAGFTLPADTTGYYVKVFVWDSISGMTPLSNAVTFH